MKITQKQKSLIVPVLLAVNMVTTIFIALYLLIPAGESAGDGGQLSFDSVQNGMYVLYIGTNDKDTYEQIIPTEQAKEIVNGICAKYVEGYTASDAKGGWVDEKGVLTQENTLVYTFTGAGESEIVAIMREVLTALNQNAILVERRDVSSAFYDGEN